MPRYMMELLSRIYMCRGYCVSVSVPIEIKKRSGSTTIKFLDVLAIKGNELVLIEARSFRGVKRVRDAVKRVTKFFVIAENTIKNRINAGELPKVDTIKKVLYVEDEDYENVSQYSKILESYGITLEKISNIYSELIECAFREEALRKERGEGDTLLAIIARIARYLGYGHTKSAK